MGKKPGLYYEKKVWDMGYGGVAGCDEVGRGCFAGPVVAGCVSFHRMFKISTAINIDDSKRLTPKDREKASYWIKKHARCYGIGKASVNEINKIGIKKASEMAFRRAIKNSGKRIDYLLIDAFYIPFVKNINRKNQLAIIKGDSVSFSIAAASIIAKVYRDKLMESLGRKDKFKIYSWDANKGYGTKIHRKAILEIGTTRHHRMMFVNSFLSKDQRLKTNNSLNNSASSQVQSNV